MKRARILAASAAALLAMAAAGAALVWYLNVRGDGSADAVEGPVAATPDARQVARGEYLTRAGNCMTCHTARGTPPWAGGRPIDTPFGAIYSSNLTPDDATGIGRWSRADFWRALHNGRSRDGRLLYPAFPYTSYTQVTREDSDAIYAYLRSLAPVSQANRAPGLRFPYNLQASLAVWRALYFRPGSYEPEPAQTAEWNRGAYLVRGLGHCTTCHSARDALGGSEDPLGLRGGLIPVQNWYAPSLASASEAGLAGWPPAEVVKLLKTGRSTDPRFGAQISGPMTEVVLYGTQYLSEADLSAMAVYLQALPQHPPRAPAADPAPVTRAFAERGARIYADNCAACHGERGEGVPGAYPALAANRAVTLGNPANLVQTVLYGGFGPATAGNPRPYGMPPYVLALNDDDIAAVLTHIRGQWGNQGAPVSPLEVNRLRAGTPPSR